ncbi:MAG: CBS domain-containing protein [Actinobacteria bacterium]|nr:CBS domain-containing protein [Actinomycetota bacterium]MBU4392544.1 CBS domain-containing protein [Actinomycetota bacterium]MBU4403427.1 CBS domain-containing protein [Actinomycetota bacterium]MBU4441380.1 CBS domain-containing protein [Actinomycetota bacterium]
MVIKSEVGMLVGDAYNPNTMKISMYASLSDITELLSRTGASDIMVVDKEGYLVGVASEGDLIRAVIPEPDEIVKSDLPLLTGFEIMEEKGREIRELMVKDIMVPTPITVTEEDALISAAQIMLTRMIRRLPVVKNGKLIGSLSRADVCKAVLGENLEEL